MQPFGTESPETQGEEQGEMPEGAYEICLTITQDGGMSVSVDDGEPTPVGGLKEAIEKIIQLVQEKDSGAGEEEAGFSEAFGQPEGAPKKMAAQTGPGRFG